MYSFRCKHDLRLTKCFAKSLRFNSNESSSYYSEETEEDRERRERVAERPVRPMPDHIPQMRKRTRIKPWWRFKEFITINPLPEEPPEWTETPQYPAMSDSSLAGVQRAIRLEWYECIRKLPTAQQKMYEISKHYAHKNVMLEPVMKQYNSLPLIESVTKTHLIRHSLPQPYQSNVDNIIDQIKQPLIDTICLHLFEAKQRYVNDYDFKDSYISLMGFHSESVWLQRIQQTDLIEDVIKTIRKILGKDYEHLKSCQLDINANVKSHWWVKEFPPPFAHRRWYKHKIMDQSFTYRGTHALNMRVNKPLPPILSVEDPNCNNSEIASYKYSMIKLGHFIKRDNFTMMPGFWLDNSCGYDFPFLLCHSRHDLTHRLQYNQRSYGDNEQVIDGMAILSSFGWLNGMAANLGFTIYDELTYPLTTQVIVTDGQYWSFYVYQLNTHTFYSDFDTNPLNNVCWSSGELKLFDAYEDNQLKGVNDEVIRYIIRFMTREPQLDQQLNLRPYLGVETRDERDIQEMTYALRRKYSNAHSSWVSARQRVHVWERVYKYHPEAEPTPHLRQRPKLLLKFPPFFKGNVKDFKNK